MNPAGLRIIGLYETRAIEAGIFDLITPQHRASFNYLHHAVIKGATHTLHVEIQGSTETRRWVETYAVPFRNPATGHTEHLAVPHDVTELSGVRTPS